MILLAMAALTLGAWRVVKWIEGRQIHELQQAEENLQRQRQRLLQELGDKPPSRGDFVTPSERRKMRQDSAAPPSPIYPEMRRQ